MSQILNKVRDVDPNNSDAVKEALSSFFHNLPKYTEEDCKIWLRTLESVITRFPKYCMSHRNTIETYLSHFLDSNIYYDVIEAAKCAHALQQVRPTQEKTATAKSSWRDQMNVLCNAAHSLVGAVFSNSVDIYRNSEKTQKNESSKSSPLTAALSQITTVTSVLHKQPLLCTRLRNVFVFIQAMLVEVYPVAKPIRPQTILDVIVRALSVSSGTDSSQNLSDVLTVKTQALRTLDAMVACLGPNLIPFSPLIFKFAMQTLKWSSENTSDESRQVRCAAYSSVSQWMSTLVSHRADASRRGWEDELASYILADITPPRRIVQLTMNSQPTKHLSKKARRKLANTMLQESNIASHMPGEKNKIAVSKDTNDEVAISALECAETFLTVCGIFLKHTIHKSFQERLVRECSSLATLSLERALRLLRALDAGRRSTPPGVPPPTQYCLHVYSDGLNSEHVEISRFCSQALLDIRLHLHCSPPSLNFALQVQPEEKRTEDKKEISIRNRLALEALLGSDKLSPQSTEEEVITIPDEPCTKKRRVDDPEKISLSSESVKSVDIDSGQEELDQDVDVITERLTEDDAEPDNIDESYNAPIELDETDSYEIDKGNTDVKELENKVSEIPVKANAEDKTPIYEAATQMPENVSNEAIDEENDEEKEIDDPVSMEVAYDYPNTGKHKVTVLEKIDDENIPSSNETDDIQITCGQVVNYSQESEKKTDHEAKVDVPKVNGIDKSAETQQNGAKDNEISVTAKVTNTDGITVEDMLADFVDEVNEDTQAVLLV